MSEGPSIKIPTPAELLAAHKLSPKKSWGQNFLHDPRIHAQIVNAAKRSVASTGFNRVVEIGVGLGTLTSHMLNAGLEVWGVERDRDMCEVLREQLGACETFKLHEADAVRFDYAQACPGPDALPTVVGNLPYQLTGPLLFRLLEFHERTAAWIVMVQKEVGVRLCAGPGSKDYGGITVAMGRLREVSWVCDVGPGAFLPPPRVDSAVLMIHPRPKPLVELQDPDAYLKLVRAAFQQRRKTLLNGLSPIAPKDTLRDWFSQLGIDPGARAETLTVQQFGELAALRERSTSLEKEEPRSDA